MVNSTESSSATKAANQPSEPNLYWVAGLPFDALSEQDAAELIISAIQEIRPMQFITPNLDILSQASKQSDFFSELLHNNLSLADGMPVVWLARLCGAKIRHRVSGSNVFDTLNKISPHPIRVFFFGGPDGAAAMASKKLSEAGLAMIGAGGISPGTASAEVLSNDAYIDEINDSNTDFLVVSLGARKATRWIHLNHQRLQAPAMSHLGAVVNFVAGTISRAPVFLQKSGLEWLWRIFQEPTLWRRYANNFKFLVTQAIYALLEAIKSRSFRAPKIVVGADSVQITGDITEESAYEILSTIDQMAARTPGKLQVRFSLIENLDTRGIGLIYQLAYRRGGRYQVSIDALSGSARKTLQRLSAERLLTAISAQQGQ